MLRKTLDQFPLARPYLIVIAIAIPLFWPTWFRLTTEWLKWEQVLAHGLPTFLIFIGLLLIHPPTPATTRSTARLPVIGSLMLIVVVGLWALMELVRIDTLTYLMLPAGLLALCWTLLGWGATLRFLPYVLLFGLSLPIWADLVPYLVILATAVVTKLVSNIGVTALIEGANITLPYGRLVIADGCSGIRYFAISILIAMMVAILNDFRWKGWVAAVITGIVLALVVNWVRITALVIIAYQSNMESSLVADHETFGWAIYAAFVIPALWLAPVRQRGTTDQVEPPPMFPKAFGTVVVALLIGPLGISLAQSRSGTSPEWTLALAEASQVDGTALPLELNLPETLSQSVWRAGPGAWVSLAQSRRSEPEAKLVPYLPPRVTGSNWFLTNLGQHYGDDIRIYQRLSDQRRVVSVERFHVGSRTASTYRSAKLLQIPATLAGEDRFALLSVQATCSSRSCDESVDRVKAVLENLSLKPDHP